MLKSHKMWYFYADFSVGLLKIVGNWLILSSNSNESENNKLEYSLKDKERIKIMADFEELSFSYLGLLSNAHHDGTTQQILASFQ